MANQDEFRALDAVEGFTVEGGKRSPATLELGEEGRRVAGGAPVTWRGARLQKDEADDALLVLGDGQVLGSTDPRFLRALEGAAGNELDRELSRLQGLPTGLKGSGVIGCLAFFGLLGWGVTSVPGCYHAAVDKTVDSIGFDTDESLGEAAQESIDEQMNLGAELEDEEVLAALEAMVERLAPHFEGTDHPADEVTWRIRVVESETPNAFALPGGYITVLTQLIEDADSPDMVAGVVAHEMGHVVQRHGLKRMANTVGVYAGMLLVFGDAGGLVGIAGQLTAILTTQFYGREQESEADRFGTEAMISSGLDAVALGRFFQLLKEEYGEALPPNLSWLGTHPGHDSRTAAIEALIEDVHAAKGAPRRRPLDIDWDDIRRRVGAEDDAADDDD
ncbi:MAG: M48 family metallopeptidase [Planctomycetota bacterium]|nr:M48 family metallopeptidase [Planctomycetota bacterium]